MMGPTSRQRMAVLEEEEKKETAVPTRQTRPLEWFEDLEEDHYNPYRVDPDSDSELSGLEDDLVIPSISNRIEKNKLLAEAKKEQEFSAAAQKYLHQRARVRQMAAPRDPDEELNNQISSTIERNLNSLNSISS